MAMVISKRFLRSMAQPFEVGQDGISLWGLEDIKARQARAIEPAATNADQAAGDEDEDYFGGLEDQVSVNDRPYAG